LNVGASARRVVLGPRIELHTGVHGALYDNPPPGYRYLRRNGRHVFLIPPDRPPPASPTRHRHWAEFVDFGRGDALVHSSRWPVLHRRTWVTDMDDFGYPVLAGRHALSSPFRRAFAQPWSRALEKDLRLRAAHMLLAYADPSCQAILFRTERGLRDAAESMRALGIDALADTFLSKSRVVYPAVPAISRSAVSRKWETPRPLRVVFCGRDFESKAGPLALGVLGGILQRRRDLHVTVIGPIPETWRQRNPETYARLEHYPARPRRTVLTLLCESHILFHPTERESVGMILLEAAAAGMAVVASQGRGTAHIPEIVNPAGLALVQRDSGSADGHKTGFESLLERLITNPSVASAMGRANHDWAVRGPTSLARRDRVLGEVYERALRRPAPRPLSIRTARFARGSHVASMTSEEVAQDEAAYCAATGMQGSNVYF